MRGTFADSHARHLSRGLQGVLAALLTGALVFTLSSARGQENDAFSKQALPDAWHPIAMPAAAGDTIDVLHYDLALTLDMTDGFLGGTMRMRVRLPATGGGVTNRIPLHAAKLEIDSALVDGTLCTVETDSINERVFLVRPEGAFFMPGEEVDINIHYRRLPGVARPGLRWGYYFFLDTLGIPSNLGYTMSEPSDARYWMPCHDEPWDKASAELRITVPEGYVVASNGKLISALPEPGGKVAWLWRESHPIAPYLMSITASRFTIATLPYVRAVGDTIPLQYYVWAADSLETARYLPTVRAMVEALSARFGPYPFDKYGMTAIVPFGYGGMEHQSITTMNWHLKTDEQVVVHELAHQWWGDLVTCATWPDIWLNESFATYSEALWAESRGGNPALRSYMHDELLHFMNASWQGAVYDPVSQGHNLFDAIVYSKGAWILHTLRGVVGDSAFFRILEAYRARHSGGNATTAEFQAVADSVTGTSTEWFFRQWIYGKGWPIYSVRQQWTGDSLVVTLTQEQTTDWPLYAMPLTLKIHGSTRDTVVVVQNNLRTQSHTFGLPFLPDSVTLDPDGWVLKQVVRSVTVVEEPTTPASYVLEQNYPNPFNSATTIRYSLPAGVRGSSDAVEVTLTVYDVLGREVRRKDAGRQQPGISSILFDADNLSSGVYYYRLEVRSSGSPGSSRNIGGGAGVSPGTSDAGAGTWRETRSMVLIR